MDFTGDPIAQEVQTEMDALAVKGVTFKDGVSYNRVFELVYRLIKEREELKNH